MKDYDDILVALRRITRAIDLQSKHLQKETGLTTSQLLLMELIEKISHPTPSELAREMVLSQATVTSLIDRLEKNNLVKRSRSIKDKRQVTLALTEAGSAQVADAPELLQVGFLREFRKLPDWQRNMLVASLQNIAALMDAEAVDASPILDIGELSRKST